MATRRIKDSDYGVKLLGVHIAPPWDLMLDAVDPGKNEVQGPKRYNGEQTLQELQALVGKRVDIIRNGRGTPIFVRPREEG